MVEFPMVSNHFFLVIFHFEARIAGSLVPSKTLNGKTCFIAYYCTTLITCTIHRETITYRDPMVPLTNVGFDCDAENNGKCI